MKTKIKRFKRYITGTEKLEYFNLRTKNRDIIDHQFYRSNPEQRRAKWEWLYNTDDGKRFRYLQYKKACNALARRSATDTLTKDFNEHIIHLYELEEDAPRGFNVFSDDRNHIQKQIFNLWIQSPAGHNWRELKRNIGMMHRGKLKRCHIHVNDKGRNRIFTYKKKWDHEKDGHTGFNHFKTKKGVKNFPVQAGAVQKIMYNIKKKRG